MTYPVFSAGEVLRATDMNAVGLWKIGTYALSTATTDLVGIFSSNYDNYRLVFDRLAWSGTGDLYFRMLSGTTPETGNNYFWAFNGLSQINVASNSNGNAQSVGYFGTTNNGSNNLAIGAASFDVYSPNLASRTLFTGMGIGVIGEYVSKVGIVSHNLANAYTGLRLTSLSAVTITGNVTVYGYQK